MYKPEGDRQCQRGQLICDMLSILCCAPCCFPHCRSVPDGTRHNRDEAPPELYQHSTVRLLTFEEKAEGVALSRSGSASREARAEFGFGTSNATSNSQSADYRARWVDLDTPAPIACRFIKPLLPFRGVQPHVLLYFCFILMESAKAYVSA